MLTDTTRAIHTQHWAVIYIQYTVGMLALVYFTLFCICSFVTRGEYTHRLIWMKSSCPNFTPRQVSSVNLFLYPQCIWAVCCPYRLCWVFICDTLLSHWTEGVSELFEMIMMMIMMVVITWNVRLWKHLRNLLALHRSTTLLINTPWYVAITGEPPSTPLSSR